MITDFRLPDLGEGLPEAELVQWLVAEGDTVALNQTIAEVETAKAIVELPSPHAGRVSSLHALAGDVVEVGAVLISFDLGGDEAAAPTRDVAGSAAENRAGDEVEPAPAERQVANLVGYGAAPRATGRPRRRARVMGGAPRVADVREPEQAIRTAERPRSTPPVRALAKQLGVDLALVVPSGSAGVISRGDVESFAHQETGSAPLSPATAGSSRQERVTRTPIRGVRKHTAEAMVHSAFTAPHVTTFLTVDVTATSELIASLRADRALDGHRIGVMAVAAKAACLALMANPSLNSKWDAANDEIVQHHYVNLGIAAATDRGLVVPNIRDADGMTLVDLADAIAQLASTARAGKTAPSAMTGGTFSISNVGVFGIDAGTPIINPGEAGILALGAVRRQPWEYRGEITLRDVMTLSLSFDHRLTDGQQGAAFLTDVGAVLREPGRAMLLR